MVETVGDSSRDIFAASKDGMVSDVCLAGLIGIDMDKSGASVATVFWLGDA
ncbi:hypothetical protein W02_37890 [Nitrospira sp. KM1]|nr:hypothetical protein W02_37890 [Nitrospira sp. KM1]